MARNFFIDMQAGKVVGESEQKGVEKHIHIESWNWGLARSSGGFEFGKAATTGTAMFNNFTFSKVTDSTTARLFQLCSEGSKIDEVFLVCRKSDEEGSKQPFDYLKVKFKRVVVTSVDFGGSSGSDLVTENVTLSFEAYHMKYKEKASDAEKEAMWNIRTEAAEC